MTDDSDPFADIAWEEDDVESGRRIENDESDDPDSYETSDIGKISFVLDPQSLVSSKRENPDKPSEEEQPQKKKPRLRPVKFKEEDYEESLARRKQHAEKHIEYAKQVLQWTEGDELFTRAKSTLVDLPLQTSLSSVNGRTVSNILHLRNSVRNRVKIIASRDMTEDEGRDGSTTEELLNQVLQHLRGGTIQWLQVFYALLKGFQIRCRWMTAFQTLSLHPQDYADLLLKAADNELHYQELCKRGKGNETNLWPDSCQFVCSWLEIWLPGQEAIWMDISEGMISISQGPTLLQSRRFQESNVDILQIEDRRPVRQGYVFRDLTEVFWSARIRSLSASMLNKQKGKGGNSMGGEMSLRYRSWLRVYVESISAPPRTVTSQSINVATGTTHSSTHSRNKVLKVEKVGADYVIDLLDDNDSGMDSDVPIEARGSDIRRGEPANAEEVEEQERLLQHFALQRQQQQQLQQLPTSLAAFKNHPVYALARDLLSNEALKPSAKAVAVIRGNSVYLREMVAQLHTMDGWRRRLRRVKDTDRNNPVKVLQRKIPLFILQQQQSNRDNNNNSSSNQVSSNPFSRINHNYQFGTVQPNPKQTLQQENFRVKEIRYYGEWQTEEVTIPPVDPTTEWIPRNEYGNLEIWDGGSQFVPRGAAYVAEPSGFVEKAAKHLGVQYVPAVTGFEAQYNHALLTTVQRPRCQGIVVLQRDAALVQEVGLQLQALAEEKESQQRFQQALKKWEKLVRVVIIRQELKEKYGA